MADSALDSAMPSFWNINPSLPRSSQTRLLIYCDGGICERCKVMDEDRIVTELFFEKPSFQEVSRVATALKGAGVNAIVMPPEDRGINTHLIVENADMEKTREKLKELGVKTEEKQVIIIKLDNRPGTMADAAKKISDRGINLVYAFSVAMTPTLSYVLLGAADNEAALKALKS